jgi:hypothetical protein
MAVEFSRKKAADESIRVLNFGTPPVHGCELEVWSFGRLPKVKGAAAPGALLGGGLVGKKDFFIIS